MGTTELTVRHITVSQHLHHKGYKEHRRCSRQTEEEEAGDNRNDWMKYILTKVVIRGSQSVKVGYKMQRHVLLETETIQVKGSWSVGHFLLGEWDTSGWVSEILLAGWVGHFRLGEWGTFDWVSGTLSAGWEGTFDWVSGTIYGWVSGTLSTIDRDDFRLFVETHTLAKRSKYTIYCATRLL